MIETVKISCNNCLSETIHDLLKKKRNEYSEVIHTYDNGREESIEWWDKFEMLQCRGCYEVTLRKSHWFSEEHDHVETSFYPPRVARKLPHWFKDLRNYVRVDPRAEKNLNINYWHDYPTEMWADLLEEIYTSIDADSRRLAAMGARALLDSIMETYLDNPPHTFDEKLKRMEDEFLISLPNLKLLSAAIDVGHAAAHRCHNPSRNDLNHVMDIVEGILHSFILDKASVASNLKENTPQKNRGK
jgi:hypothetical protein